MADGCCGRLPLPVAPAPADRCRLFPPQRIAQGCCDPGCAAPWRFAAGCCPWLRRALAIHRRLLSSTAPFPGGAWSLAPRRAAVEINLHADLRNKTTKYAPYCVIRHASLLCRFFARVFRATRARMPRGARSAIRRPSPRRLRITAAMPAASRERQLRRAPVPKRQMPSTILLFCCRGTACSCSGAKGRRMEGRKKRRTRQRLRDPSARETRE